MGVKARVRPKGSGEWWVFIDHQGKRKAKKVGRVKRVAIEVAKKIEAKLVLGDAGLLERSNNEKQTFKFYSDMWLRITVPATCKASTASDYDGLLRNHILPVFANIPVSEINRLKVKKFLMEKISAGYANSTVIHMKNAISGILNLAVDDEVLPSNPAHKLGKLFIQQQSGQVMDPLTRNELSHLLKIFQHHYPKHYPMALTLARTGMRVGEVIGLQWNDIDFNSRFIIVQRGLTRGRIETTKNNKIRRIDMSRQLSNTLSKLKHHRKLASIRKGWGKMPEWVFVNAKGMALDSSNWRNRIFNKALEKA